MESNVLGATLQSDAHELKTRLEWGQPGCTIIDVRDRYTYNHGHITGAIPLPLGDLAAKVSSLPKNRDIYVYGENDEQSAHAAQTLREAGFAHVLELTGGFNAWKKIGGPTEGV